MIENGRTWGDHKAYMMVQQLAYGEGIADGDGWAPTEAGAQVAVSVIAWLIDKGKAEGSLISVVALDLCLHILALEFPRAVDLLADQ